MDVVFAVTSAILDGKETLVALRVLRNFSNTAHVERGVRQLHALCFRKRLR